MCGIFGTTARPRSFDTDQVRKRIAHRGPDTGAEYRGSRIYLAHARLAIIEMSDAGAQPMTDAAGRATIVFNGEIYNYQSLRAQLEHRGYYCSGGSDTEVLLQGYLAYGTDVFSHLTGMWAVGIYDHQRDVLVCARDPFGIKPLYYMQHGDQFSFASEIRAVTPLCSNVEPNTSAYYQLFNLGYFIDPDTHVSGVYKCLPGEVLEWRMRDRSVRSVPVSYSFADVNPAPDAPVTDRHSMVSALDAVLRDRVAAHMVADVPVGILLSGGTDSSLIAALARALGYKPHAYTVDIAGSADAAYAREVAQQLDLEHTVVSLSADALFEQYDAIHALIDEPTADSSILPTALIYNSVAERGKVVLSGEGGDELFGGYDRIHRLTYHGDMGRQQRLTAIVHALQRATTAGWSVEYVQPILRRLRNTVIDYSGDDLIEAYLKETRILDYPISMKQLRERMREVYGRLPATPRTPAPLAFDTCMYLPNDLLYKTDAASMAYSVEARVPLVDAPLLQYVDRTIPSSERLAPGGVQKALLKEVLANYLPSGTVYRSKKGFSVSLNKLAPQRLGEDLSAALRFHQQHADAFGIDEDPILREMCQPAYAQHLLRKYPQFAFALLTNYRKWQ
jgi:asparagine synthase (glutamine-hydrolysing)